MLSLAWSGLRKWVPVLALVLALGTVVSVSLVDPAWAQFVAPELDTTDYMAVAAAVLTFVAVVFGIKKAIRLLS